MPSKVEGRRFDVGAIVMAKWPRTKLYFKGLILDYNDIEYLVRFDDDDQSELAIKYKDVQSPFKNRSRSRSLGRTPGISPSRKSPGRKSPSRKSPGRKSPSRKSPSRRSPARQSPPMKSPSRKSRAEKEETTSSSHLSRISIREKEEKSASLNEEKDASFALRNRAQVTADISVSRHAAHISTFEKKIPYADGKSNSSSSSNSIKVDTKEVIKSVQEKNRIVEALKRFAIGVWVTLKALPLAAVVVTFPFLLSLLCSTKKCSVQLPDIPRRLSFYYDQNALIIAGTYILSLLILAFVPIGKTVKTKTGSRIRCNGYLSLMAVSIAICVFLKMGYKSASIYLLYQPFMIAFTGLGIVISFLLYFKAFYARRDNLNPHGNTGYYLVDFIEGREVSPRIGSFDLKFFLFRIMLINIILINFLVVAKDLQGKQGHYSPTLLVVAGMQVFYAFDHVLFEDSYLTTYEYMNHGVGFVTCVGYLVAAFTATIYSRYVHNHGSELPWYYLVGIVGVNLFGYTILRGANSQKHAFKTNPADPALVHLESLPTSTGKRLLVSGWWGLVRHPNYLGDMIVQISWALICGFNHNIPWIVATTSIIYLLTRIFVVEKMCKAKYGLAWSSYTSRVPYRLLPKVF